MTLLSTLNLALLNQAVKQPFTSLTSDSRKVKQGSLFLAYPGEHHDGRDFIAQAIQMGAAAVLWESQSNAKKSFTWQQEWNVHNYPISNLKHQVGEIAAEHYQYPSSKCRVIGVTGTNGKTSVSQWIAQCLTWLGQKTAVIGTIGNGFFENQLFEKQEAAVNTTPDAIVLQELLAGYVEQQARAVVMEVSSHGLAQGRVNGVAFEIAILTNLTRDHLDYHQTMEAYAAAKRQLFDWQGLKTVILNADDAFGARIAEEFAHTSKAYLTYGMHAENAALHADRHVYGHTLQLFENGLSMIVKTPQGEALLEASVLGEFNAYNLLAVLASLLSLNISLEASIAAIKTIKPVAGRMQQLGGGSLPLVVIDYAHTPDALEKVLTTLMKQLNASNQEANLICVFGCGGNRDAGKRALMGQVVAKHADAMIVTSDNPRNEVPINIINEIVAGITREYFIEIERADAINLAISMAKMGDIILIAGKGHEHYQEIAGMKHPFSDLMHAQQALQNYPIADYKNNDQKNTAQQNNKKKKNSEQAA